MNLQQARQHLAGLDAMRADYHRVLQYDERTIRPADRKRRDDLEWALYRAPAQTERVLRELVAALEAEEVKV